MTKQCLMLNPYGPPICNNPTEYKLSTSFRLTQPHRESVSQCASSVREVPSSIPRCDHKSLLRACLHVGGGPQIDETCGGSPHLTCKHDQIKMRHKMDRRVTSPKGVTSPTWGPPPPCKQVLRRVSFP